MPLMPFAVNRAGHDPIEFDVFVPRRYVLTPVTVTADVDPATGAVENVSATVAVKGGKQKSLHIVRRETKP